MNQTRWSHSSALAVLAITLIIFTALWMLLPQEYMASDPGAYSRKAFHFLNTGEFSTGVFGHRLALILPTAFFYELFGVNILSTNLICLISCFLIIYTVWLSLPDTRSKVVGATLCLTSVPLYNWSLVLFPDIVAAAFMAFSFHLLLLRQKVILYHTVYAGIWISLLSIGLLFFAFLAKLSAYWVIPLWILAFIVDLKSRNVATLIRRFWIPVLIFGFFLGLGYLLFNMACCDDPLARLKMVQSLSGKHTWSWENASKIYQINRLTILPANMIIEHYGTLVIVLAASSLIYPLSNLVNYFLGIFNAVCLPTSFLGTPNVRMWFYYGLTCLLFFWFGSTSFTSYEPMPLKVRMTLPMLPPFIILAAYLSSRLLPPYTGTNRIVKYSTIFVLPAFVIIQIFTPFFIYDKRSMSASSFLYEKLRIELPEQYSMDIVQKAVRQNPLEQILLICTDDRSPGSLSFYFGYENYPENLLVAFLGDLHKDYLLPKNTFIYIDRHRADFLKRAYGHIHYNADIDALNIKPLYEYGVKSLIKVSGQQWNKIGNLINSEQELLKSGIVF